MVMNKHILFIVENNSAPNDVRVWNEAMAAKNFGYNVSIICTKSKRDSPKYEVINDIKIFRHFRPMNTEGKFAYLFEYGNAIFWEFLLCLFIYLKEPFHLIHSANPPDHVFIIAAIFKIFGVKYVFDHHDITPENYLAKFSRKDLFFKILLIMEKLTFKVADIVVSTNESYRKVAIDRGNKKAEDVFVVRNGPNLENIFFMKPNEKHKKGFEYLVAYVGAIGIQEGVDNLLRIIQYLIYKKDIRNIKFVIVGKGPHLEKLVQLSRELKIEDYVFFTGFISYEEFYEILATADICVNPEYRNEFTDKSTMLKIMDYMVMGKPIVMFETKEGKVTAQEAAFYIEENDDVEFAKALVNLLNNPDKRKNMGTFGRKRIDEKLNWNIQKQNLKAAYEYVFSNIK